MQHPPSTDVDPLCRDGSVMGKRCTPTSFTPAQTVRCIGARRFRTQAVRDVGCLLDMDFDVVSWTCFPTPLTDGTLTFLPDFEVVRETAVELVTVLDSADSIAEWVRVAAKAKGMELRAVDMSDVVIVRLENARELLRYAGWRVSLSDRIRILAALDHEGSMSLVDCMSVVRNATDPIGVVAALALRRFVEIDVDSGPLGPETRVTRFRG